MVLEMESVLWEWEEWILIFMLACTIFLYFKRSARMRLLEKCGIPGPTPNFWTGNLSECFSMGNVLYDSLLTERFGDICGYYLGAKPIILVSDPKLLKIIEVEEAKCFANRPRRVPGGINPDPRRKEMLGNLPADRWNFTRKILSKAFTPSKLKETIPQILSKIGIFMSKIEERLQANPLEVDFYQLFQCLTLDIIGQTGFGVECNIQQNIADPLHTAVQSEFCKSPNSSLVKLYLCLPECAWIVQPIRIIFHKLNEFLGWSESSELWDQGFKTFHSRLNSPYRPDLLQQLLDSELRQSPLKVVANTVLFFEAAYETLSGSLGFIVHLLVNNLEVQDKVRDEMQIVLGDKNQFTYEDLVELKYLEMVIKEALRMYPPQTTFIGRFGNKDLIYKKDDKEYRIPAGVHVQAGLYQIQNSTKHWVNPEQFNPDRFQDKTIDASSTIWQAFGRGPRICIGQSFAWIVLKLVLANILIKYELKPSPSTEAQVTLRYKVATMTPANGSFAYPQLLAKLHN